MPAETGQSSENLGAAVRRGFAFAGSADTIRHLAEFATGIMLARLLLPADFGVVAVITSFLQISYIVGNLGMGGAVIQATELSPHDRHAAFAISVGSALMITAGIVAMAPWAAGFFSMPILAQAMPIMSVQVLLAGLAATSLALLRRDLAFGRLAIAEIGATATYATIGIGLAVAGWGVWSLVWAALAQGTWTLSSALVLAGYRPRPSIRSESVRKLIGFGTGLTVKNVFVYISRNIDNLIVAKMLGPVPTGLYNRAFNLTRMPQTRLVTLVYRVFYPAFCRVRHDVARFQDWYLRATVSVAVVVTPILIGLCAVGEDFTIAVLGSHWAPMVPSLRILCVAALISSLHMLGGAAIEATGRVRYEVATQSIYALIVTVGCVFGARFGIQGVSWAIVGAAVVFYVMKAVTLKLALGLPVLRYIGAVLPSAASALVMAVAVLSTVRLVDPAWFADSAQYHWVRLLVGVAVGVPAYVAALFVVGRKHFLLVADQAGQLISQVSPRRLKPEAA